MNHRWKEQIKSTSLTPFFLFFLSFTGIILIPAIYLLLTPPTLAQAQSEQQVEADRLLQQGNQQFQVSQYREALQSWQKALDIFQQIGDRGGVAKSLNNLGNAYYSLGDYRKAIEFYQQSLAIYQEIRDRGGVAKSLGNLGLAYDSLGEYTKAIEFHQQSLAIKQEIGDRGGVANSIMNLGSTYYSLGEYTKAIEFHQQSLAIKKEIGDRGGVADSLNNLGIAYYFLGEYQKVIEYQQQSLAIFKEIGDRGGVANSLGNLGLAYRNLGKYQKAIKFYQQSLTIFKHIGDREGEGSIFSNFGILYEEQEQPELAIVFYKQSVIIRESIRQDIQDLDQQLQEFYTATVAGTYRRLADLLLSQDRIWEAQQVLELLKLQEIQDFTRSQKARRELAKVFISPQEQKIIDDYGKLIGFGQEIERCKSTQCPNLKQLQTKRNGLKKEFNQEVSSLESFIRQRNFDDFQQFLLPTSFNQTANKIIQASNKYNAQIGTAVIYPLVLKDKIWILWAVQGKVIGKREITNVGRQKLNQEILKLSLLVKNPHSDTSKLKETSQQLYDWLIRPLESELDNINHLAFSLDRGLRYIPMEVLHDGKQYLIEKYTVTTFISAQFTDTEDRLPSNLNETLVLGMGASQVDGYDSLPHVVNEINAIVRENQTNDANGIYPGAKFLEKDFSWDNLWTNLEDKKLLHIATHGEFVPSSQDASFLVLGDGNKLTIKEIQILDDYLDDVHLVVLSACETAVGEAFLTNPKQEEGIEINALSFYFLSGGAKTVMASLWRVDDESTSQLMQRFYCTLANGNTSLTKAEALQKAKMSLLHNTPLDCDTSANNTDFTHPYYWSPFILIGNGL